MGNRVLNNLLYYQSNYFLIFTIFVSIAGLVYPWNLLSGATSVGIAFGAYIFTVHQHPTLQDLRKQYPYASLVFIVIAAIVFFTTVWNVVGLLMAVFIPTLGCLIHASYRLRSLKNKVFNKLDQGHKSPMLSLLPTLGYKVKGLPIPPELRNKIDEALEELRLEETDLARKRANVLDSVKDKVRKNMKTKEYKSTSAAHTKEGETYGSNIGLHIDLAPTKIPDDPNEYQPQHVAAAPRVVFDLETTGFGKDCEIVQLSAVCGESAFNRYILPTMPIHPKASEITMLQIIGGQLCHRGEPVATTPIAQALLDFIDFLKVQGHPVVIVGHNIRSFDLPILHSQLQIYNIYGAFREVVGGFLDTKLLFQGEVKNLKSYKQEALVKQFLDTEYETHNAVEDCQSLQSLLNSQEENLNISKYMFSHDVVITNSKFKGNRSTFTDMVIQKSLSSYMADKLARSGLNRSHLVLAHKRHGKSGLAAVLAENRGGKPIITNSKTVIQKIVQYLEDN